jgi:hypothetical protein
MLSHNSKSVFLDAGIVFKKYNITLLTAHSDVNQYMLGYPFQDNIASNQFLNTDILSRKLKLIWHSVGGAQIELAYFLICIERLKNNQINNEERELSRMLAFNHLSLSYENIYRVWEKITSVLYYLHYKKINKRLYYDGIITEIDKSNLYEKKMIRGLKKQIKHWNRVACKRNKYSHEESVLFFYDYEPSMILNASGIPFYMKEMSLDLNGECSPLIESFKNLDSLNKLLLVFINNFPRGSIERGKYYE